MKRYRQTTPDSEDEGDHLDLYKSSRLDFTSSAAVSLPCPYCSTNKPSFFSTQEQLARHYTAVHTFICKQANCDKIFPDQTFLDLHLDECHNPLEQVRRQRGEKTFKCFVNDCSKVFGNPKNRRLHLIDVHKYPKEFTFSLPNTGINDVIQQNGSLLRKPYNGPSQKNKNKNNNNINSNSNSKKNQDENNENERSSLGLSGLSPPSPISLDSSSLPSPLHDETETIIRNPSAPCPSPNMTSVPLDILDLSSRLNSIPDLALPLATTQSP